VSDFALRVRQQDDFSGWYQAAVRGADLAEDSGVRGCMIIKPWGMGIWDRIRHTLGARIRETGHDDYYFPLLIPLSHFQSEAEHVEGFAKEMAVVTHHRVKPIDGRLQPDPASQLEEPLIIRPTSETIIGSAMSKWIKSYRDLPLLLNQWANVMRWEMRTRMFLRTSEFLWQEGHTAHANGEEAMAETEQMLEVYREIASDVLALHVLTGAKPAHERFPGAVETLAIEAMMRDGKALQAGTSHYLGTNFSTAQNIKFQDETGAWQLAHTTSWGASTRLIGALIMAHGDDDGLKLPPAVAPHQIVIVPLVRSDEEKAVVYEYVDGLARELRSRAWRNEPLRVFVDRGNDKPVNKRWNWIRKGVPLILEVGPREAAGGQVTCYRRDRLRDEDGRLARNTFGRDEAAERCVAECDSVQSGLRESARAFTQDNIVRFDGSLDELDAFVAERPTQWLQVGWSAPEGPALQAFLDRLATSRLTVRILVPETPEGARCIATGAPATAFVLIAKAY